MDAFDCTASALKPRRKILFFVGGTHVFGAEIVMLEIMSWLRDRGHDVRCVVSGWNDGDFVQRLQALALPHYVVKLGFLYVSRPLWTLDSMLHYPGSLARIAAIMGEFKPDVVYHNGYRSLLMSFFLFDPVRTLIHFHQTESSNARSRLRYRAVRSRARRFFAVSKFLKEELIKNGIPGDVIEVVYPAIQIPRPGTEASGSLRGETPRIGIVGQLIPMKGHLDLFHALGTLRARGYTFSLEVFGRGPDDWADELKRACGQRGLTDRTTWHGFVADRVAIYGTLDVVVVPTRESEAFGMVAAEPALWNIPVIASDAGGLSEVVVDGETGLLFRAGDTADLADKLEQLLSDAELRQRLGANARRRIERDFTPDACFGAIERAIEETCAPGAWNDLLRCDGEATDRRAP